MTTFTQSVSSIYKDIHKNMLTRLSQNDLPWGQIDVNTVVFISCAVQRSDNKVFIMNVSVYQTHGVIHAEIPRHKFQIKFPCSLSHRLNGQAEKASASRAADLGSILAFAVDLFSRSSHTTDLKIGTQWLLYQAPGGIRSALGLLARSQHTVIGRDSEF